MRTVLLVVLSLSAGNVFPSDFAVRSDCQRAGINDCLVGLYTVGASVALLGSESSTTCNAKSIGHYRYVSEVLSVDMTDLDTSACQGFKYALAYKKPDVLQRYQRIELANVRDLSTAKQVDLRVRSQSSAVEQAQGEHRTALAAAAPAVYALPVGQDVYLAVYENKLIPGDQTHILYVQGTAKRIHGAAELRNAFFLNQRFYLHYHFTCRIGCGYVGDFVVEITSSGFTHVFLDSSWST
jgi:hypothetical protein